MSYAKIHVKSKSVEASAKRYAEIHVRCNAAVFRLSGFRVTFSKRRKTLLDIVGECVYQISGLYRVSFCQVPADRKIHRQTYKQ